jgi:hypothetical protein
MVLLVNNAQGRSSSPFVGDLISPRSRRLYGRTPIWAADNDAFHCFDEARYRRMLDAIAASDHPPRFVTLPDVVGDHRSTLALAHLWKPELDQRGLPAAFVLQNGVEQAFFSDIPAVPAFFIGGDDQFKMGAWVQNFGPELKRSSPKTWLHLGRVNSIKRLRYALRICCDSCDGSGMGRFEDNVLHPMIRFLHSRQLELL